MINNIKNITNAGHRKSLTFLFVFLIFSTFIEMVGIGIVPLFATIIINPSQILNYLPENSYFYRIESLSHKEMIVFGSSLMILIFLLKNISIACINYFQLNTQKNITKYILDKIFSLYLNGKYEFHLTRNSADLVKNISAEAGRSVQYIFNIVNLVKELLIMFFIFITLLFVNPLIACFIFIIFIIFSSIFYIASRKGSTKRGKEIQNSWGQTLKILNHSLGSMKLLKIYNKEGFMTSLFNKKINLIQNKIFVQSFLVTLPRLFLEFIAISGIVSISVIYFFLELPIENFLPLIALIVVAAARLIPSFNVISRSLSSIKFQSPSIELISKEIKLFENSKVYFSNSLDETQNKNLFMESIEFKDVVFSYLNSNNKILNNFNLVIHKGDFVGISGQSGSGKSTLVDLMVGLLEPTNGEIFIDKKNLKNHKGSWIKKIGYVPQETYLIDDTIKNNIAFSEDLIDFNSKNFEKAIKLSRLDELINSFEEKENKVIGERGMQLSGGQKQRIGIARALYLDPEILVLDEPTSALDKINEDKIIEDLNALNSSTKITILLISHKESVFKHCNKKISLDDNK